MIRQLRILGAVTALTMSLAAASAPKAPAKPTFNKDVAPIFYSNCVECHRSGEVAPMSLLTYKEARPWVKSIREKVMTRTMPPWHADAEKSERFSNDRRMKQQEVDTIVAWIDNGAKEGGKKDLPPAPVFEAGWKIGKPDVIFSMPQPYEVPAKGAVEYQYYTLPTGFTEDKWVQKLEIKRGNPEIVHHIIAFLYEPKVGPQGSPGIRLNLNNMPPRPKNPQHAEIQNKLGWLLAGSAPGEQAIIMPPGTARRIPKGAELILQVHYTPNGKAVTDLSSVGMIFAKGTPQTEHRTVGVLNGKFAIPPNASGHRVESAGTFTEDAVISSLFPHMHLRGKSFEYRLVTPDGKSRTLLTIPNYDFNWQAGYEFAEPVLAPKGSRLECTAYFDNSKANKYNPDPSIEVRWGDQTWEEMMIGWATYSVVKAPKPAASGGAN